MKTRCALVLSLTALFLCFPAFGDTLPAGDYYASDGTYGRIDPQMQVARHGRGVPASAVPVWGLDFDFEAPIGAGIFNFFNENDEAF